MIYPSCLGRGDDKAHISEARRMPALIQTFHLSLIVGPLKSASTSAQPSYQGSTPCLHPWCRGILLRESSVLDALTRCSTVALDKTGTLTSGTLSCTGMFNPRKEESIPSEPTGRLDIPSRACHVVHFSCAACVEAFEP